NFNGYGEFKNFESAERSLLLSQEIQLGNKRGKREKVAVIEEDLILWNIKSLKLDIIKDATQSFYDTLGLKELLNLNIELTKLAEKVYQTVNERVSAGKVSPLEEIKAKASLENQKIELKNIERKLKSKGKELNAILGNREQSFETVEGNLEMLEPLKSLKELTELISKNPDIARLKTEEDHRRAVLKREESQIFPDITIAGGVKNINGKETMDEKTNKKKDNAYVVEFSMPLKVFDRNQGNIREASQCLEQINKEQYAAEVSIYKGLNSSYEEAATLLSQISFLRNNMLPAMEKVFNSIQEGYRFGKFSYLEVLDAQRSFFESKSKYLESLFSYHKVYAEIERLVGETQNSLDEKGVMEND
ncbi:MAG: TolC family protein, partial [Candidatus Omnitrophica bacterium]|nr:TolC family protein [Candidatus Omnitrophota bacterium]